MLSLNRILCPIDFSDFSLDALRHGVVLAKWYSAELTLLHVEQSPQLLPGGADALTAAEAVRRFAAPLLESAGVVWDVVVKSGVVPAAIIKTAAEQGSFDLLILGTHGRSGFARLFLGSVTERVLRSTCIPTLAIPPPVTEASPPVYKTILCPVEFSGASERALEYALSLAKASDARLILLHVIDRLVGEKTARALGHLSVSDFERQVKDEAVRKLRAAATDETRVWARPEERVTFGRPHAEILNIVAEERVDLIVMGVQGAGAVDRLLFGSTAHRVIREAGCPVLTVHRGPTAEDRA